jgi:hypothetical protein
MSKNVSLFLVLLVTLSVLSIFISCGDSLDPIKRDVPPVADGVDFLTIYTSNTNNSETLGAYTLTISGPGGNSTVAGTTGEDVIPVIGGTYTVTSSKTGFL